MVVGGEVLCEAFANLPGQVQAREAGVFLLDFLDDPQALAVVFEAAAVLHQAVQRGFTPVPERRVAQVMGQRDGLGQIFIQQERPSDIPRNGRDLHRVRQARAQVIARAVQKNLGLVFQPAESARMNDAVAIALVLRAPIGRGFAVTAAASGGAELGVRRKSPAFEFFKFKQRARHGDGEEFKSLGV